jgi:hypothetical protein
MKSYIWFGGTKEFIWPSTKNENKLTWKCKLFGCKDYMLPLTYCKDGEKHGVKAGMGATATTITLTASYKGCIWCRNYIEIINEGVVRLPGWICDCEICQNAKISCGWKL